MAQEFLVYHPYVEPIAKEDVLTVLPRDVQYGGSWQRRGGTGIFHVALARKWDRIEHACQQHDYDVIAAYKADPGPTGLIDDLRDLRRYLLLLEALLVARHGLPNPLTAAQTDSQDRVGIVRTGPQDTQYHLGSATDLAKYVRAHELYEHDPASHEDRRRGQERRGKDDFAYSDEGRRTTQRRSLKR